MAILFGRKKDENLTETGTVAEDASPHVDVSDNDRSAEVSRDSLRKLKRQELLEIMLRQQKQIDELKSQLARANAELDRRQIEFARAGTLADAVIEINGVLEAAQKAGEDYVRNIMARADKVQADSDKDGGKDAQ